MHLRRARILVVDDPEHELATSLGEPVRRHHVDTAKNAVDAMRRIDGSATPYDVVICDLARERAVGPALWSRLSLGRIAMARRVVFVASAPLRPDAKAFLARVPNICVELPTDPEALDALISRRAAVHSRLGAIANPGTGVRNDLDA